MGLRTHFSWSDEMSDEPKPVSNLEKQATAKPKRVYKKRVVKKPVVEEAPAVQVNSFHLVAVPSSQDVELDMERMVASLQSISSAVVQVNLPPRFMGNYKKIASGMKILPIPSETTPIVIKLRDSYTDALPNSIDFIAEHGTNCILYGVYLKRSRFSGEICQATILHQVSLKTLVHSGGLKIDKNEVHYLDLTTTCAGLFEATTNDIPDLSKYINERFSL
jgi:hypothetical protein